MTPADALPWISAVIAVGGLLIAGLSQWLAFRDRTHAYQLRIYDKQVEAMQELSVNLSAHLNVVLGLLTKELAARGAKPLTDEAKVRIRSEVAPAHQAIAASVVKWQVILPDSVTNAVSRYNDVVLAATAWSGVTKGYVARGLEAVVNHSDPGTPVVEAYRGVIQAMRTALGTQPLSQTTLRLLGRESRQPD